MWVLLGAFLVLSIVASMLKPKQDDNTAKPDSLGDMSFPTAEEGRSIPVIMGTCKLKSPNVTWYGDLSTQTVSERVKTGMCSSQNVTTGYKYYIGMMLSLCLGPIDELSEIWVGDDYKVWSGSLNISNGDAQSIYINKPTIFDDQNDGKGSGGGVQGRARIYFGSATQPQDGYYACQVGSAGNKSFGNNFYGSNTTYWEGLYARSGFDINQVPAFRRCCYVMLPQFYIGQSSSVQPISFVIKCIPKALGLGEISGDANPAEMIYAVLTDTLWGLSISPADVDVASFTACGYVLRNESCGLSMIIDTQAKAGDIIESITKHIDASVYTDLTTGKIVMKLIRNDYTVASLPILDMHNVISVELDRQSWPETFNEVKISFIDRSDNFKEKIVQAADIANYYAQGGNLISQSIDYKGFSNATSAKAAASRALKVLSNPLAKLTIVSTRRIPSFYPGGVFVLNWPPQGITNMVCRLLEGDFGELADGQITLTAIEDVYGTPTVEFVSPPASTWVKPIIDVPPVILYQYLTETPYYWAGTSRQVSVGAVKPCNNALNYDVYVNNPITGIYELSQVIPTYTPAGVLMDDYIQGTAADDSVGFIISNLSDLVRLTSLASSAGRLDGSNLLAIDNEIMAWQNIVALSDGTYKITGILRGIADTTPIAHSVGSIVYFISQGAGVISSTALDVDTTVSTRLYAHNSIGVQTGTTTMSLTTSSRAWKPYPPGRVRINNTAYPTTISSSSDLVVTWDHRNRISQGRSRIYPQDDVLGLSPEGSYTVNVYFGNTLVKQTTGITTNNFTFTKSSWPTITNSSVKIEIIAVNGTYSSRPITINTRLTGYGLSYGTNYGQ